MANWRRGAVSAFWAVDRALGGQRPPTRLQKWVGRHPVRAGAYVGVPAAFLMALVLLLDGAAPGEVVVGVLGGLLLGLVFGLTAVAERLRQRRLGRLGVGTGADRGDRPVTGG